MEGNFHRAKGAVKESVGHAIGNEKMEKEGKQENIEGKLQKEIENTTLSKIQIDFRFPKDQSLCTQRPKFETCMQQDCMSVFIPLISNNLKNSTDFI